MICTTCFRQDAEMNSTMCKNCRKELDGKAGFISHEQLEAEIRNASISRLPAILQCAVMACVVKGVFSVGKYHTGLRMYIDDAIKAGELVRSKK